MRKVGFYLVALAAIVAGLLFGTLNSDPVQLDLLWYQFELPLGFAILLGFSFGVLSGLSMIYLVRVVPLRMQLRKVRARLIRRDALSSNTSDD